ncbi:MAG: SOS response-associated peptidase [Myxococcota bacterium]|nr:SOS response-associated peptidase [Myxococcota bacterium]
MCGRITLTSSAGEIARQFDLEPGVDLAPLEPRYNVAPSQDIVAVRQDPEGRRVLSLERWGLVPHWAKDPAVGNRMINARAESVATKPAFRSAFRKRRCLVPADGFFEWSGSGEERRPYLFRRPDRALIGIAGLYERWTGEGGEVVDSCTLITTEANACLAPFHHRMPVILGRDDYGGWLDRSQEDVEALAALLSPCPADWLEASPVSKRVNNPRNDDAECLVPEPRSGDLFG